MPSPAEVVDEFRSVASKPGGFSGMGQPVQRAALYLVDAAEEAAVAAEGEEIVGFAAAIGEVLADLGGWAIILCVLAIIISLKQVEFVFTKVCDAIPFGLGSGPRALLTMIFRPIDNLEGWVADRAGQLVVDIVVNVVHMFRQFWHYQVGNPLPGTAPATATQLKALQNEVDAEDAKIRHLTVLYNELAAQVHGASLPSTSTTTLNDRVARLERLMIPLVHDLNALHHDVTQLDANYNVDHRELQALQTNLNAVRAVQFNVQDVLTEVQNGIQYAEYEIGRMLPQIDAHARTLHVMMPLQGLLYLGQPGLKNLEKLERNPCQCPQLPELPGDQAALLAAYEFITHG